MLMEVWSLSSTPSCCSMQKKPNISLSSLKVSSFSLAALCLVSYWNSLSCGLVHDDIFSIVENGDVRPGDTPLSNLLRNDFWGKPMSDPTSHKSYRPITTLSFRINYWLHELDPVGYHAVNILLHYSCTVLFYWLARSVVLSNTINKESTSFMMSALFAVHPIHTEAVSISNLSLGGVLYN